MGDTKKMMGRKASKAPTATSAMRRFQLIRDEDVHGVSGTGLVAEGVEFTPGWCAVVWLGTYTTITFFENIKEVEAVHGHDGRTKVRWVD